MRTHVRAARPTRSSIATAGTERQPDSTQGSSGEELTVADLHRNAVILREPCGLFGSPRRSLEQKLAPGLLGILLRHPELVVIEDAQRLHHVGRGDPPVTDDEEVLGILPVHRPGEVVRAKVDPSRRLVEVDHDEFVVHTSASAPSRFL